MAILGAQAVVTLVMISFLQKICPIFSVGRWLLTSQSLVRYLYPTNEELKKLLGRPNGGSNGAKKRGKDHHSSQAQGDSFSVPKSIGLTLSTAPLTFIDVLPLRYYSDLVWLMDFLVTSVLVVLCTSIYQHFVMPNSNEYGLASVWCLLLLMFSLRPLLSMVTSYKLSQNSGEIVLSCLFGFFFLILSMVVLIIDDSILEFHIEPAHANFTDATKQFLSKREITSVGPTSLVTFRAVTAITSGFIGSLLTFPGIRLAKTHLSSLKWAAEQPFVLMMMHIDLIFPMFLLSLWVPPISRNVACGRNIPGTEVEITDLHFDIFRVSAIVLWCLIRMCLLSFRLQAHLNTAATKLELMRKEAGRITNIELRSSISQVTYYIVVVAIQLVAPVVLIISIILMSWSFTGGSIGLYSPSQTIVSEENTSKSMAEQVQEFSVSLAELRAVFSAQLFGAATSYLLWWVICAWTITSYFGMFYNTYMAN